MTVATLDADANILSPSQAICPGKPVVPKEATFADLVAFHISQTLEPGIPIPTCMRPLGRCCSYPYIMYLYPGAGWLVLGLWGGGEVG